MHLRNRLLGQTKFYAAEGEGAAAPAPEPAASVPAPTPESEATAAPSPEPAATAPTPKPEDWRDRRIAELTHKLNEERKKTPPVAAVVPPPVPSQAPGESEASFNQRVADTATEMVRIDAWNKHCNDVAAAGAKEFTDFGTRLAGVKTVVNDRDMAEVQAYNDVLAATFEAAEGNAHKLLYSLTENPGEFRKLMEMSPTRRAVELTRKADKLGQSPTEPEPSGAPRPITAVSSRGLHYDGIKPDDAVNGAKLPIGEWMAQREKQAAERGIQ